MSHTDTSAVIVTSDVVVMDIFESTCSARVVKNSPPSTDFPFLSADIPSDLINHLHQWTKPISPKCEDELEAGGGREVVQVSAEGDRVGPSSASLDGGVVERDSGAAVAAEPATSRATEANAEAKVKAKVKAMESISLDLATVLLPALNLSAEHKQKFVDCVLRGQFEEAKTLIAGAPTSTPHPSARGLACSKAISLSPRCVVSVGSLTVKALGLPCSLAAQFAKELRVQCDTASVFLASTRLALHLKEPHHPKVLASVVLAASTCADDDLAKSKDVPCPSLDAPVYLTVFRMPSTRDFPPHAGKATAKVLARTIHTLRREAWQLDSSFMLLYQSSETPLSLELVFARKTPREPEVSKWGEHAQAFVYSQLAPLHDGFLQLDDLTHGPCIQAPEGQGFMFLFAWSSKLLSMASGFLLGAFPKVVPHYIHKLKHQNRIFLQTTIPPCLPEQVHGSGSHSAPAATPDRFPAGATEDCPAKPLSETPAASPVADDDAASPVEDEYATTLLDALEKRGDDDLVAAFLDLSSQRRDAKLSSTTDR